MRGVAAMAFGFVVNIVKPEGTSKSQMQPGVFFALCVQSTIQPRPITMAEPPPSMIEHTLAIHYPSTTISPGGFPLNNFRGESAA
jgi:hypothetical protein